MNPWLLLSPYYAAALTWLLLIVAGCGWLVLRAVRPRPEQGRILSLLLPSITLVVLTLPLWGRGLAEEWQCRDAGLRLDATTIDGAGALILWKSFEPDPNMQSVGALRSTSALGHATMAELVRGVAEGRISGFELPFEPRRSGQDESRRAYQRFFLGAADKSLGDCVNIGQYHFGRGVAFAPGACLAVQLGLGSESRHELGGLALRDDNGRHAWLLDRATGQQVASYSFVHAEASDTLLAIFRLRSYKPRGCRPEQRSKREAAALVH